MTHEQTHLIVGASLAGVRAAEAMRAHGFAGRLILMGAETELPYHRPPLSKDYLGDAELDEQQLLIAPDTWFAGQDIDLRLGARAERLDVQSRQVELESGECLHFDRALICTGSVVRRIRARGAELPGVLYLRTLEDARRLRSELTRSSAVLVVGAGLIGLEVAAAARLSGKTATIIDAGDGPLRRFVPAEIGSYLAAWHRDHGVSLNLRSTVARFLGLERVEAVELRDGTTLPADLVVVGIGVTPATSWLEGSGLALDDGVVVDARGATNVPGVFAAGDVARTYSAAYGDHVRIEQYGNAHAQGALVGANMAGATEVHTAVPSTSSEQFGARLQFVGRVDGFDALIMRGTPQSYSFTALFVKNEVVVAAFAMNRAREFAVVRKLVVSAERVDLARLSDQVSGPTDWVRF
jgi:3-phenylpropionate/trans-cinnamate dioxygenase ferredoxin reductase component